MGSHLEVQTWSSPSSGHSHTRPARPRLLVSTCSLFFLQKKTDEAAFQKLMSNLDSNKDNEVDFQEYCVFLSCIAMMCNEFFEGCPDKQPRKK